MANQTYTLIFEGNIAEGHSAAEVKKNLASLLKKDVTGIEPLFAGKPVVIKKDMARPTAEKYRAAFIRAGALLQNPPPLGRKPHPPKTGPPPPPAGESQTDPTGGAAAQNTAGKINPRTPAAPIDIDTPGNAPCQTR